MLDHPPCWIAATSFMVLFVFVTGMLAQAWYQESRTRRQLSQLQAKLEQYPNASPYP